MAKKKYNAIANSEKDVSQTFLKGAAILTISMVVVKIFGLIDKVLLADIYSMFGDEFATMGVGLYSNAYEIFVVIFTVATGGLPIAISRLISESIAQKRYKDVKKIHRVSIPFFITVGIVSLLIMVFGSLYYVKLIDSPYSIYAMMCLAPTIFFGCLVSIYRGYFEGQRNMMPTAISEIIEAGVKLVVGALLAYLVMRFGMEQYTTTGQFWWFKEFANKTEAQNTILAFSVAGAICGISLGSFCSFVFYFLRYKIIGDGIPEEYYQSSIDARTAKETLILICKTAVPTALGVLIMSLGSLVDQIIIQRVLHNLAETNPDSLYQQYNSFFSSDSIYGDQITIHTQLWGCYSAALTLMQLVTAVTQVFGSSAMPNVTSAWTKNNRDDLKKSVETVLRMTMLFTLPMSLGLCALAHPIMQFIYTSDAFINVGGDVLMIMGITTIFTATITPICSMLQGIGKVSVPTVLYTICMLIKIGITWMFVSIPEINIQGATAGSMISYAVINVVGMFLLLKYSKVRINFLSTIIKPLIGAVLSSVAAFVVNMFAAQVMPQRVSTILSILAAVLIYAVSLLILRAFTADEVKFLPKGEKIAKVLEKWHLIG
ncbi:MAG: polysaccharide biosynthesis C-terminal domain-containing protein [Ruminococcus sp.]|nr:polysaccharide biosynthesis C-terminal domain-containing protein [Ruminococcus sp.]